MYTNQNVLFNRRLATLLTILCDSGIKIHSMIFHAQPKRSKTARIGVQRTHHIVTASCHVVIVPDLLESLFLVICEVKAYLCSVMTVSEDRHKLAGHKVLSVCDTIVFGQKKIVKECKCLVSNTWLP